MKRTYFLPVISVFFILSVMLLINSASAQLHGNEAEAQAVSEMRARLQGALAKGDLAACKREGENLARYRQTEGGEALINADIAAVERRLREVRTVYDQLRQIRDLKSKEAVEQAYGLIRAIAVKMAEDAVTEVTVTLVTAPVPGAGKIVTEMGKQAADFLGNFNDAGQVVNRARAMQSLEAMARYADEQMTSLIPAIQDARWTRGMLNDCRKQYLEGVAVGKADAPAASAHVAEKGTPDQWSNIRVTLSNVSDFKTKDQPGWRNNGTGFTARTGGMDPVHVKVDIKGKGNVSYFDYKVQTTVSAGYGKDIVRQEAIIPKEGGSKSYECSWDPRSTPGTLNISVHITGGNPEFFTYYVSGSVSVGGAKGK